MRNLKSQILRLIHIVSWLGLCLLVCIHLFVKAGIHSQHWLSLLIVVLPHLYLGLFLISLITLLFERNIKTIGLVIFTSAFAFAIWFPAKLKINTMAEYKKTHPSSLRLMTWNVGRAGELTPIHFSSFEKKKSIDQKLECILSLMQHKQVDIIVLQEISNTRIRDLKNKVEIKCRFTDYFGLGHDELGGLAICIPHWSRWELLRTRGLPVLDQWRTLLSEVKYQNSDQIINILNVHFTSPRINMSDLPPFRYDLSRLMNQTFTHLEKQDTQYQNISKLLYGFKDPTLIAGDFNSPPEANVHQSLKNDWIDVWAFNGTGIGATKYFGNLIPFRIDFIYAQKKQWYVKNSAIIPHYCSDHLPVYSELLLLDQKEKNIESR